MGKRYYCDFCDKSFADNPTNRKNHLKGVSHQRMRKLHYSFFKDPSSLLAEESTKKPCRTMMTSGECPFGEGCKYSHLTEDRKKQLEQQILQEKAESVRKKRKLEENPPSIEDWLAKRAKAKKPESPRTELKPNLAQLAFSLPPTLLGVTNLPPSLLPPPPHVWCSINLEQEEWG
ncbi:zinc finger matrin-type protein 5 [Lingula anatina]|uniref:Zinc finger matrin-type protein 5 n=1 Tax=Lingula anatina TaxID=7574 RepID=A0A1S3I322_LINAN|nr:zinc finger matrin-type protein 5 [Lingula anatina]|eukprot:XP_013392667.1 zinc finger matrin-type protein 5 [Lingula anatina]